MLRREAEIPGGAGPVERGLAARGLGAGGAVALAVGHGECLAVTGASGTGKSLLLRMLADLVPHAGEVWLDGAAQRAMPAPEWRRRVSYVATDAAWWGSRVAEHFAPGSDPLPMLSRLRLPEGITGTAPERLSTGERQRLSLARAMARGPGVLLLDEPTSALDPEATARVEAVLAEWRDAGGILVVTSHDAAQVARLATRRLALGGAPA